MSAKGCLQMAEGFTKLLRSELSGEELLMELEGSEDEEESSPNVGSVESESPQEEERSEGTKESEVKDVEVPLKPQENDYEVLLVSKELDDDKFLYPMRQEKLDLLDPSTLLDMAMKRAGELSISGSSDLAVKWRVKCVALAKLVYGDQHWKLGQAYGELAQAYLNLKGLPQQAYHHGLSAKEILVLPSSDALKSVDGTMSVIRVYIIIGHASLCLHKYDEAVKAFHKAEKETEKLRKVIEDPPQEFPLQIAIGMGKGLYGIRQYEKSRDVLQKGLVFVRKTKDDRKVISVLQDLADASAGSGDYSLSVSSLEEAQNLVAEEFGEKSEEMAQIEQKLAKALMSTLQVHEQERVLKLMTKAHSTLMELDLKKSAAKCLEEMCKFYVQMGKPEEALLHLKTVIKLKKEAFGDFSAEVGESHRLTGTIYLSQGRMAEANKHLRKSLEILTITLGKKHKCTVEVERILALAAIKGRTKSAVTERPRFKTVFGSEGTSAKSSIDLKSPKKSGPSFDDRPPFSIYLKNDAFW